MRSAFVASGGGIKAYAFHLGALRALEESGFRRQLATDYDESKRAPELIDTYIGSSAGACIAAACVFFETLDEAEGVIGLGKTGTPRFSRRTLFHPNAGSLRPFKSSGLFYAAGVEKYFRARATTNDFTKMAPNFFVCATQLNSSRKVVFGPRDSAVNGTYDRFIAYYNDVPVSQAIAASVSVPGVFQPYKITNKKSGEVFEYIDGEIRETLSTHVARDSGVDLVIVSNVWMPYHYDPEFGSVSRMGMSTVVTQTITQIIEQKVDRLRNEFDRCGEALSAVRQFGKDEKLPDARVEALIHRMSEILRYRSMDEIWISPDRYDSAFNLAPAWTFDANILRFAKDVGYRQAQKALAAWHKRREKSNNR